MNIDPGTSIAVTQNFVSSANLDRVMRVLETRDPDLVSGCPEVKACCVVCCGVSMER